MFSNTASDRIVAFANTNGGTIYIGVQDSGEITGLENPDFVMQQISNALRESIRPDERDYPEYAVREALLNAIVHREYA